MDQIFIEDLPVNTLIGVYEHERHAPQALWISLRASIDSHAAARSDHVDDAVDYAAVADAIQDFAQQRDDRLLETFADALAAKLMKSFRLGWVKIRISKPAAVPAARAVGIEIERGNS